MTTREHRRSIRIKLGLPIEVSGENAQGKRFVEHGEAIVVSRHGAKILLANELVQDQVIKVLFLGTGREGQARVVGVVPQEPRYSHGIELLDTGVDLWGIEVQLSSEPTSSVRILMECTRCHAQEFAILNEFEAEVLGANDGLSRSCSRCNDINLWKPAPHVTQPTPQPAPSSRT